MKTIFTPWSPVNCAEADTQLALKSREALLKRPWVQNWQSEPSSQTRFYSKQNKLKLLSWVFFSSCLDPCLKIDTAGFTFCTWHQKRNFLFEGMVKSKQAGMQASQRRWNKMDCIATKHPIFNSIRSPSPSWQCCAFCHFTWLITCGGCSRNTGAWTAGSWGSTLEMTENHKKDTLTRRGETHKDKEREERSGWNKVRLQQQLIAMFEQSVCCFHGEFREISVTLAH